MEDNRFREVPFPKKKNLPHTLHWFLDEDYFSDELYGLEFTEIESLIRLSAQAFDLFERATQKILDNNDLDYLGIPKFFHSCIYHSWQNRDKHPFFLGRFDLNGGIDGLKPLVIEFNADTFSTLPETLQWQSFQVSQLGGSVEQFNNLEKDLTESLQKIAAKIRNPNPVILASTFGYKEDVLNANCILDLAHRAGYQTHYLDLEYVVFSEEGIFKQQDDEYIKADVWFKIIPWDWMFNEEPELARLMSDIIVADLAIILNPPYSTIWQNKLFLSYITQHFPNRVIAETFNSLSWGLKAYAQKPVYGRIGENILIKDDVGNETRTNGDYSSQATVYQQYCPLPKDSENYYYQIGMFHTDKKPSALNLRAQDSKILNDDCEFMSHYVLPRY